MGRKDKTQKMLVGCPDVFAEILNVLVYDGENIVNEGQLLPAPTESIYPQTDGEKMVELQQFQDFSMYDVQQDEIRTLYTTENQSSIDTEMVLRCAGYNGMAYRNQYTKLRKSTGQNVYPVISLVLNWSEKRWNAARSIRELLTVPVEQKAEPYIDRNEIHVFDMRFLKPSVREKFHGDMRVVLDYLADPDSLRRNHQTLRNPEEVLRMLAALSGDKRYLKYITSITCDEEEGEQTNMCELLDRLIAEGRSEGLSEGLSKGRSEGLSEGLSKGRSEGLSEGLSKGRHEGFSILISTCKDFKLDYADTAAKLKEKYGLSDAETEENMKLYWK